MRTQFSKLALAASLALALALTLSCSSNDDGNNNSGTSSPSSGGGSIVNADNEAWISEYDDDHNDGMIFKPNGEVIHFFKSKENPGKWCLEGIYAYSIINEYTLHMGSKDYDYSFNGDTLTFRGESYLRTSRNTISRCNEVY